MNAIKQLPYILSKDGIVKFTGTEFDCFLQLQRMQSQSAEWAMKYEGWKVLPMEFKTEWNELEFARMKTAIRAHFWKKQVFTRHNPEGVVMNGFRAIEITLGLAYTSSGVHACYSICNTQLYYDEKYDYKFFIMTTDGVPYAELWDNEENEMYIPLESVIKL